MRSGGEPTSVLWGDTAAASSLSTPLFSAACSPTPSGAALLLEAMNCFEGPPHHHHLTNIHHHHAHHQPPPVIHLLPPAATPPAAATPGRSPATGVEEDAAPAAGPSTPPRGSPEDGERPATRIDEDAAPEDKGREERPPSPPGPGTNSPHATGGGHVGSIRVKQEIQEGEEDAKDDSGISPGSGGGAEREVDDDPHLEDSPGGSSRGGIDRGGQGEDGPRSPYSEGCYSEGCEDADLRRLQYSESAGGGPPYSEGDGAGGQRPDAASDEDDAGGDVNKPRITSQGKFKTFRCKQCDFVALTKLEFWEHSRMHIRAERLLTCPRCPFVTEYKHHLEYHLRNHFGSKPFKCPHCPYTCVNKSMLNSHLKSHSSVYQYRCADCGYATKYCHSLKLHLRKYSHQPAMVLHPDGSPNPLPVIDVYGTRRGPKTGSKKVSQQSSNPQEGTAPTSPPSPTTPASTVPATTAVAPTISNTVTTTVSSSGHPFQAMVVYPSSQSPSYANGSYFGPASTAPSSAYSTPQTSRPILPRVLQPRAEGEDQWMPTTREDHPEGQAKKAGSQLCVTSNRPVKCTLCEFASTSREAFAEHMMMHAANGDVGNRESGAEAGTNKALPVNPHHHHHHHHQQQQQQHQPSLMMSNGFVPAQAADAGLKEYLARMLTAVVPQIGTFRGPVLPQLQAQWHAHVQQQMQHPHFQQASNGGVVLQQNPTVRRPASPQSIQRPWMNQEAVGQQAQLPRSSGSPSAAMVGGEEEGGEVMATVTPSGGDEGRGESRRVPNGGVPLDLTKESIPRLQSEYHLGEQKGAASGGSSRRKGRAFKLERISRNLQRGEEEGDGCSSGEDDEERHSRHSDNDEEETSLDSTSKRRKAMTTPEEPKAAKVPRNKEDKEDYHCPYCDIAFRDVVLYTMHMGYHGYQDPFKCNMCGQETNDKVSFFLHIARSSHS